MIHNQCSVLYVYTLSVVQCSRVAVYSGAWCQCQVCHLCQCNHYCVILPSHLHQVDGVPLYGVVVVTLHMGRGEHLHVNHAPISHRAENHCDKLNNVQDKGEG